MNDKLLPKGETAQPIQVDGDTKGLFSVAEETQQDQEILAEIAQQVADELDNAEENTSPWNIAKVEKQLLAAYTADSETDLLKVLKDNSFLFYDLYSRKYGIQPIFLELSFGTEFRCDFAWLNDNSSGPEWVLVELESPKMPLFNRDGKPTAKLNGALEQVKTWDQYFDENKGEAKRIFGAVAEFRFILVAGSSEDWATEHAQKWRIYNHKRFHVEIRSMATFLKSIKIAKEDPDELWSFKDNPVTLPHSQLEKYWSEYGYMDRWIDGDKSLID